MTNFLITVQLQSFLQYLILLNTLSNPNFLITSVQLIF